MGTVVRIAWIGTTAVSPPSVRTLRHDTQPISSIQANSVISGVAPSSVSIVGKTVRSIGRGPASFRLMIRAACKLWPQYRHRCSHQHIIGAIRTPWRALVLEFRRHRPGHQDADLSRTPTSIVTTRRPQHHGYAVRYAKSPEQFADLHAEPSTVQSDFPRWPPSRALLGHDGGRFRGRRPHDPLTAAASRHRNRPGRQQRQLDEHPRGSIFFEIVGPGHAAITPAPWPRTRGNGPFCFTRYGW